MPDKPPFMPVGVNTHMSLHEQTKWTLIYQISDLEREAYGQVKRVEIEKVFQAVHADPYVEHCSIRHDYDTILFHTKYRIEVQFHFGRSQPWAPELQPLFIPPHVRLRMQQEQAAAAAAARPTWHERLLNADDPFV